MHTIRHLHIVLERPNGLASRNERRDLSSRCVALDKVAADVALDAARVVPVAV